MYRLLLVASSFRGKRSTKYRTLLRKETYKDQASYTSSPPCTMSNVFKTNRCDWHLISLSCGESILKYGAKIWNSYVRIRLLRHVCISFADFVPHSCVSLLKPHISLDARVHRIMVHSGNVRLFRNRFFSPSNLRDLFPNHVYLPQKPVMRRTNSLPPILLSLLFFLSLSAIARLPIPALFCSFFLSLSLHRSLAS